jgi:hypothetical protein
MRQKASVVFFGSAPISAGHRLRPDPPPEKDCRHCRSPLLRRPMGDLSILLVAALVVTAIPASLTTTRPAAGPRASDASELKPLADVHEFMEHVVDGTFATVKNGLKERPVDAKAWRAVRDASLLLGECGNLLLIRKPDGADGAEWSKLSTALRESGDVLTKAAKSKDYDASRKALLALVESCNQCHVKYGDDGEPNIEP